MRGVCLFSCLSILIFLCSPLSAQHRLQGRVVAGTEAAEGATVSWRTETQRFHTLSLPDGRYELNNLPAGAGELIVSYSGFETYNAALTLPVGGPLADISLQALPGRLQPVEVRALRAGQLMPFTKTNLSAAYIRKNNLGQDIPFMLNQVPNVVANSDAGNGIGYTGIRIRGTDATRINMTINGIPYNDAESQGTFFVNLPDFLSSVSSIQVQRGVGTSSNGAGAFGATMNFSTHDYQEAAYAEINQSAGSFNTWKHTVRFGSGLIGGRFTIDGRLSQISSDGFIDRASSLLQGAYLSAGWYGDNSSLRAYAILGKEKTYQAWYGIPEDALKTNRRFNSAGTEKPGEPYDNETDNYWQNHYQLHYNHQFNSRLNLHTAVYLSTGRGYYEQYKANARLENYGLPGLGRSDLIRRLWLNNQLWGQVFSLQHRSSKTEWTWGGGWNYYPGLHYGDVIWTATDPGLRHRWYDNDAFKTDINSYVKWKRQIAPHWHTFADLQYRFVRYDLNGFRNNPQLAFENTWHFVNPKAGITYHKNDWTAFLSYAVANKEPNRDDFEASVAEAPRREQLHDWELGIEKRDLLPGLQVSLTGYFMYYRDQLVLTGRINDVGAYTRSNLPRSYRLGVEAETRYRWKSGQINYALALSRNRILDYTGFYDDYDNGGQIAVAYGNTPIALSPAIVQNASIEWRPVKQTEITWLSKHVGRQFLDNAGDRSRSLNAFFVNDLRLAYDLPVRRLAKEIRLVFQLNNLFNVMYEPNGYTFSYIYNAAFVTENFYYPMAGRNWMAALNIRL